jgi:8-oxo-dGTP pyrophosphatase MutT (NUDIX family)
MADDKVYAVITDRTNKTMAIGIKAVLNRHAKNGLNSPYLQRMPNILGGKIDAGETRLDALIREIDEESGQTMDASNLTAVPADLIPPIPKHNKRGHYQMHFYQLDVSDLATFAVGPNGRLVAGTDANFGQAEMTQTVLVDFSTLPAGATDVEIADFMLTQLAAHFPPTGPTFAADRLEFLASGTLQAIKEAFDSFPP